MTILIMPINIIIIMTTIMTIMMIMMIKMMVMMLMMMMMMYDDDDDDDDDGDGGARLCRRFACFPVVRRFVASRRSCVGRSYDRTSLLTCHRGGPPYGVCRRGTTFVSVRPLRPGSLARAPHGRLHLPRWLPGCLQMGFWGFVGRRSRHRLQHPPLVRTLSRRNRRRCPSLSPTSLVGFVGVLSCGCGRHQRLLQPRSCQPQEEIPVRHLAHRQAFSNHSFLEAVCYFILHATTRKNTAVAEL